MQRGQDSSKAERKTETKDTLNLLMRKDTLTLLLRKYNVNSFGERKDTLTLLLRIYMLTPLLRVGKDTLKLLLKGYIDPSAERKDTLTLSLPYKTVNTATIEFFVSTRK